ncbi:MAG: cytochrome c peroxidase [Pseudomonadota bacterium]
MVRFGFATLAIAAVCAGIPATGQSFRSQNLMFDLGRDLFFDPVLSGNMNIACATCHHPTKGTSDGLSLGIGEGGTGLGQDRTEVSDNRPVSRVPRNAPALFNLGNAEFVRMLHDGRVWMDPTEMYGIGMPKGHVLERPVPNALAAQVHLPITSATEMAGQAGENAVADAAAQGRITGPGGVRDILAKRIDAIPAYRSRFEATGVDGSLHYADIATALAAYIGTEFESTNSPFDRHLNGDDTALTASAKRGMDLFYGDAQCGTCHSGRFQTDHDFHSISLPQIGPGKNQPRLTYGDVGRSAISGDAADDFAFRTPSLRNIELTGPYGHNGAYADLRHMVEHHLNPLRHLAMYDPSYAILPALTDVGPDDTAFEDLEENFRIAASADISDVALSPAAVDDIMAFLAALTDPKFVDAGHLVPTSVPSGLPVE